MISDIDPDRYSSGIIKAMSTEDEKGAAMRILNFLLVLIIFSACDRLAGDRSDSGTSVENPKNTGIEKGPEPEPEPDNGDPFLISKARVGKITKGMTLEELIQAYGEEGVKFDEVIGSELDVNPVADVYMGKYGGLGHSLEVFLDCKGGGKKYEIGENDNWCGGDSLLENIDIADERFKTIKGIGLGSSLKDFLKNYNDEVYFSSSPEVEKVVAVSKKAGISFEFNVDFPTLPEDWQEHPEALPPDAKVTSLWVWGMAK